MKNRRTTLLWLLSSTLWLPPSGGSPFAQTRQESPAFEVASVKAIDGFIRDHEGRQLTATTFFDRTDLLQLIVRAYLDANGAGICSMKVGL